MEQRALVTPWRMRPASPAREEAVQRPVLEEELAHPYSPQENVTYHGQVKVPDCATSTDRVHAEDPAVLVNLPVAPLKATTPMMFCAMPVRPLDNASIRVAQRRGAHGWEARDFPIPLGSNMVVVASARVPV